MALKWFETSDIVTQEASITRRKTESLFGQLRQVQEQRRLQEEEEARQRKELSMKQSLEVVNSRRCARAADEINEVNKTLQGLGVQPIPLSQANVRAQTCSGFTWAQTELERYKQENWDNIQAELRKEAEHDAKRDAKQGGEDWGLLTYAQKQSRIDVKFQTFLNERFPEGQMSSLGTAEVTPEIVEAEPRTFGDKLQTFGTGVAAWASEKLGDEEGAEYWGEAHEEWKERGVVNLEEGTEVEEGIWVMPDYRVYTEDKQQIGTINPETGDFQEMEPRWWEKAGTILKWMPPNIPVTLIKKYGLAVSEKIDLPFMIQNKALEIGERQKTGVELTEQDKRFIGLYEGEVGKLPELNKILQILHAPAEMIRLWSTTKLKPSEELKEAYYESTGVGSRMLHGIATPASVALFIAVGLGGATAAQPKLAAVAAKGGVKGAAAQVAQIAIAPAVGYEWVVGQVVSTTVGGAYKVVMTSVLKRNLHSWAKSVGVQIPRETENAFIKWALANYEPKWMAKQAIKTLFQPVKGGYTVTDAGARAAEQAAAQSVKTSPLLLGLVKQTTAPAVVPPSAGAISKPTIPIKPPVTTAVTPTALAVEPTAMSEVATPQAKEPWQMTKAEEIRKALTGLPKDTTLSVQHWEGEPVGRVWKSADEILSSPEKVIGSIDESDVGSKKRYFDNWQKREQIQQALSEGKLVPAEVLADYPDIQTTAAAEWETFTGEPAAGYGVEEPMDMTPQELKSIRQSIMAQGKGRGLSQTKLNEIFKDVAGKSEEGKQLPYRLTEMSDVDLQDTLEIVKTQRPVRIGTKRVIRPSTEKKIQSLKTSLIREGRLTDEAFDVMVEQLKLPALGYESMQKFITEKEGNSLLRLMNDEAEVGLIARQAEVVKALGENPAIKEVYDDYSKRIAKEGQVYFEGKPADVSVLKDQRFAMEDLQVRTGKEFYDVYFNLNRAKNANHAYFEEAKARIIASTSAYNKLVNNKASMERIRSYIAAKNKWAKVKSPADITPDEIKLANAYEKELLILQPDFKYHRFIHQYHANDGNVAKMQEHIPDAPKEQLRKAVNIYESKGATALRDYLDTQTWGIIGSGYEPHYVVSPQLATRKLKAAFPTRRLEPRTGVEFYAEDITISRAVDRYIRQVKSYNLKPYVRKLGRLYAEALPQLKNPYKVNRGISTMANEMLGYKDRSFLGELVLKIASQSYITVFGTFPTLPFRNLFQNLAHYPDKSALIDPRNRKLNDWEMKFYDMHTSQMKGVQRDLLLSEEGGLPGFRRINRLILRLNLYGASDSKVNRIWSMWAGINKAERALLQYQKDGNIKKFVSGSGMAEMTLTQQKQVLENLAMKEVIIHGLTPVSGGQAAIMEIANEITNNVHFLYDRSQRSWIEMGETGRIIGSLVVFPRSVVQRALIQAKTLDPKGYAPPEKKKRAVKVLFSLLWGSMAANYIFQKATGREDAPYNPLNILKWSPGGLSLGSVASLTEVAGLLFLAAGGSDWAKGQLPSAISGTGDTFIPYYKVVTQALEAMLDKKQIDRQLYRELRSIIDKQLHEMGFLDDAYEPNRSYYEAERSAEWELKHALFGTEPGEATAKDADLKTQRDTFAQSDYGRDWKDLTKTEQEELKKKYGLE